MCNWNFMIHKTALRCIFRRSILSKKSSFGTNKVNKGFLTCYILFYKAQIRKELLFQFLNIKFLSELAEELFR